jgi:hypothetical protein
MLNSIFPTDQEWLEMVNADRKREQLDKVTCEAFEIIMDRLEKEWFDLVSSSLILSLVHSPVCYGQPLDKKYP